MVFNWGITGFVPSLFSYFWLILIIAVLIIYIYGLLKFKKILLLLIAPLIFMATIFTGISNAHFIKRHEADTIRYEAFSNIFSSDYAANIEDGAHIYMRGYTSLYYQLPPLTLYASALSGNTFHFTTDLESIEDVENRYFLMYDNDSRFVMLGKIDYDLTGNELFILPTEPIANGGFIGEKTPVVSPVSINEDLTSYHDCTINIPLPYIGMDGVLIKANGLIFDQSVITSTHIPSNEITR